MIRNFIFAYALLYFSPVSFAGEHMPCNKIIEEECYKPQPCGVGNKDEEERAHCEDICIKNIKNIPAECKEKIEDNDRKGKKTFIPKKDKREN